MSLSRARLACALLPVGDNVWTGHPKYLRAVDDLAATLLNREFRFRALPPVCFLCGGFESKRRNAVRDYLRKTRPDLQVFYAEEVWTRISAMPDLSAMQMEDYLAEVSDAVVIIVESPGTYAELGAFSMSAHLRRKLLLVLDQQYRGQQSFIATGPVRWADQESKFAPSVHANFAAILLAMPEVEERLSRIPEPARVKLEQVASSAKHSLYFLCDLVAITSPATVASLVDVAKRTFMRDSPAALQRIPTHLELARAMNLVATINVDGVDFFFRPASSRQRFSSSSKLLSLPAARARFASVLMTLPSARSILAQISSGAA